MTTLMVVEPEATGHRMIVYVRLIVEEALSRGWQVILMTSASALDHPAGQAVISEFGDRIKLVVIPVIKRRHSRVGLLLGQWSSYFAFQESYRLVNQNLKVDFVYVPYLNYMDKVVGILGSPFGVAKFGGMLVSAKFHHYRYGIVKKKSHQDWLNGLLFRLALCHPRLNLVTSIDEPLANLVAHEIPEQTKKFRYIPDVSFIDCPSERAMARKIYGFSETDFVITVYGSLGLGKGIAKLLKMLTAADLPPIFKFMFVGRQDIHVKAMITETVRKNPERARQLIIIDRFIDKIEEGRVFASADIVWLCYEGFSGMSGVLIQSAQAGVPVITAGYGLIEENRRKHTLGICWDEFANIDGKDFRFDWLRITNTAFSLRGSASLAGFAAIHTPKEFGKNVIDAITTMM